ncbi:MAG TPA: M14 family metallopeptidase [Blastocatellia bacterium]|nr:M14 family metallopeptidase [Blastocatellia bacterium]HMX23981.1 M14 family metallopeptidase [Blastocatellia bacterium]HNG29425.1 M14 family metallopeptidase [Blastocatellia bacterium]
MLKRHLHSLLVVVLLLSLSPASFAQSGRAAAPATSTVPAPETVLGFKVGEDRKLAKWDQFLAYFRKLTETSDRIKLDTLGQTTLGRSFVAATISSPENLRRLEEFKGIQQRLSDPRLLETATEAGIKDLVNAGKTIVVITCSIHSTEVGGTFTATELAYKLTSENTPEIKQILDNVVVLLVPSLNPDGTDIVADWYRKTLGTPAEGTAPPELYHHYTGHDNNRDWYSFTQVETQLTVDKLLNVWRPQILHDIHQMGGAAARLFVPPYMEPWEPNVDPALIAGVNALGTAMAWEVTAQGKAGVVFNTMYDAWTPARAYAHYHAGLRILSETASAQLATPVEVPFERLGSGFNYNAKVSSWNFPKPWTGGRWTLRDIVDYQLAGAVALLNHAARNRELYLRNFYEISKRAVEAKGQSFAILLPEPEVPKSLADAFKRMKEGINSVSGTEQQKHQQSEAVVNKITSEPSTSEEVNYYFKTEGLDRVLSILKRGGVEVQRAGKDFTADGKTYPAGTHIISMKQPYAAFAKTLLENQVYPDLREYPGGPPKRPYDVTAHTLPLLMNVNTVTVKEAFAVESRPEPLALVIQSRVRSSGGVRVAMYKNYLPAMDEGWTRWLFDQYKFEFKSLLRDEARVGNLIAKFDTIILPDQQVAALVNGLPGKPAEGGNEETRGGYPAEFAGGLGEAGVKALREFVEAGGTLITFNNASNFAIERLGVPVKNVLKGVPSREFYCPGSILRTELDTTSNLTFGAEKESIAWFEGSPAFEVTDPASVKVIAKYPEAANPLLSGWILGDKLIRGKAAMVEAKLGKGRVILFGFRPQYRAQSLATLPLLFNSILTSKSEQ